MAIHDPKLEAMLRQGSPQPQQTALALTPMGPEQVVAFIAAEIASGYVAAGAGVEATAAVDLACHVYAEAIAAVKLGKLASIAQEAEERARLF